MRIPGFLLVLLAPSVAMACRVEVVEFQIAMKNCPAEIQSVVSRADACWHFAGEFNGERGERDKEVLAAMDNAGCGDRIDGDITALKKKYANDKPVHDALVKALDDVLPNLYLN